MTRFAVVLLCGLWGHSALGAAGNSMRWLVVGASNSSPAGIARAAKSLVAKQPAALVFQTRDCGEKRNVFGVALGITESAEAARAALQQQGAAAKGAYVKACSVVPRSLLALGFHAVDPSMADPATDDVEMEEADRISTATPLTGERVLVVQRLVRGGDDVADAGPLDAISGRIVLVSGPAQRKVLLDDCSFPERITALGELFAFQCIGSMAGDYSLHQVFVFDGSGRQLAKVESCRNPKLTTRSGVACSEESLGLKGFKLRPKRVPLPPTDDVSRPRSPQP